MSVEVTTKVKIRDSYEQDFINNTTRVLKDMIDKLDLNVYHITFVRKAGWRGINASQLKLFRNRETGKYKLWVNLRNTSISNTRIPRIQKYLLETIRYSDYCLKEVPLDYTDKDLTLYALTRGRPYPVSKLSLNNKRSLASRRYAQEMLHEYNNKP